MIITNATLNGSNLIVTGKSPSGQVGIYVIPWTTAQTEGISGVLSTVQSTGAQYCQATETWVQALIGQVVEGF